ncbi:[LysW]-L-2-aminoadipate/[LysW]-L-glutamate phosphate reductase [Candidatus Gugararchaeum adminiculabundum]|nr:[LysW]-L-2-aminoadipate/[LysW]-L-glutamate phosphate reductase [Candidatus Gugararchaeum adminiculabundum]
MTISANIIGASGYTGGDLLRILVTHPEVEVKAATSERFAGEPVKKIHPNLRSFVDYNFVSVKEIKEADVVFLCVPHGMAAPYVEQYMDSGTKIVDLSADFRLHNPADYPKWYGHEHPKPELLKKFVYGLPELHREQIKKSNYVACPGCLSTTSILSLAPLAKEKLLDPNGIVIDAKIGSSGGGAAFDISTHHPERVGVVRSYKPTGHRHTGEIEQELGELQGAKFGVAFSPHAVELVRGILATCHVRLNKQVKEVDIWKIYRSFYKDSPFVRIVKEKEGHYRYPEPKLLAGTNFFDVGFELDSHVNRLVVMGAIDNLVKGSGGQAVQNMNLMFGLDEKTGMWRPGLHPI